MKYPDVETASDDYASRFSGSVGQFMLSVQERLVVDLLQDFPDRNAGTLLDVGGGHAQLAAPLVTRGFEVTVVGSDSACGHRLAAQSQPARFVVGDLLALPFADRAFDAVVSVRLLSHMDDWAAQLRELCRVARRCVIVDYPTHLSANIVSRATFGMKRAVERNTRTFRTFWPSELESVAAGAGFASAGIRKQFAIPMAAHRAVGSAGLSRGCERLLDAIGATTLLGSPVLQRFDRIAR